MPIQRSFKLGAVAKTKANRAKDVPADHYIVVAKLEPPDGGLHLQAELLMFESKTPSEGGRGSRRPAPNRRRCSQTSSGGDGEPARYFSI